MSNQIELRHIRYFLAVAEELHFRKAAEQLYISQPGLSRQIKQMEEDLEISLFERHNRKVKLTQTGAYLKKELSESLKRIDYVLNHAKLLHQGKDGSLKLGYVGSAMQQIIPDLLLKFEKENPTILFGLQEMSNQNQIESLLNNDIDLGFVRIESVPIGIKRKVLIKEPFCLLLPKNHSINATNFKNLSQLKEESFILFDSKYSTSYYDIVMQIFDDSGFSPIVSHNTIHASSISKLVSNNFGVSIVPRSLTLDYDDTIKIIPLHKIRQRTELSIVWNEKKENAILKAFLKIIQQYITVQ